MKSLLRVSLFMLVACLMAAPLHAQVNWSGTVTGTDSWNVGTNWSTGSVPGSSDTVDIEGTLGAGGGSLVDPEIDTSFGATCGTLYMGLTAASQLTINDGATLVIGRARIGSETADGLTTIINMTGGTVTSNGSTGSTRIGFSYSGTPGAGMGELLMNGDAQWNQTGGNLFFGYQGNGTLSMSGNSTFNVTSGVPYRFQLRHRLCRSEQQCNP